MKRVSDWIKRHPVAIVSTALLIAVIAFAAKYAGRSGQVLPLQMKSGGTTASVGAPEVAFMGGGEMGVAMNRAVATDSYAMDEAVMMPSPMPPIEPTAGETAAEVEQRIIKTASLQLVVGDIDATIDEVTARASAVGGFVESSSASEDKNGRRTGWITVRVPVDKFDPLISDIKDLAELVREESVQGQDVTEQYTDLQARLRNAKEQEAAYLDILQQAKSVEDILKVQRELGNIRAQIESYEGRIKYLENRTSYSTISVFLETEPEVQVPTKEFKLSVVVKQAVQALIAAFQWIITALVWIVIVGLSLALAALVVLWILYLLVKRIWFRKKR